MENIFMGTSCYQNIKFGNLVSITGDGGNAWGFFGPAYKKLAPSLRLWQYYDSNPDNLSDDDLIIYYIEEYYNHRLANLDVNELINIFKNRFGTNIVLLCHELPGLTLNKEHFCHRRLLADWIEIKSGLIIPEISINKDGKIINEKIYDLKPKIKRIIK